MSKTILITGCGPGGIGFALASEFHRRGHQVIATVLEESHRLELETMGVQTVIMDVTSQLSIDAAVSHVSKITDGTLNVLINNAGHILIQPFADTTVEDFRRIFEVNVIGVFAVTRAFLPLLLKAAKVQGDSVVASQGSVNGILNPPFMCGYNASKSAVESFGNSIRKELAPFGVRIVTLKSGGVRSDLNKNAPATTLPEGSLYEERRDLFEQRKIMPDAKEVMDPTVYAEYVATELLKPSPQKMVWKGRWTTIAWILSWFWEGILDDTMIRGYELNKLRSAQ